MTAICVRQISCAALLLATASLPLAPKQADADITLPPPKILKTPGPVGDVQVGGAGQLLIVHFKSPNQLTVFDFKTQAYRKSVSISAGDVAFAAGRNKMVMYQLGSLQRYDLASVQHEKSTPCRDAVTELAMGSESEGPLWVITQGQTGQLFDVDKLLPLTFTNTGYRTSNTPQGKFESGSRTHISADGRVLVGGASDTSGLLSTWYGEELVTHYESPFTRWLRISPDGQTLFTSGGTCSTRFQKLMETREPVNSFSSLEGNYYLQLHMPRKRDASPLVTVHCANDARPFAQFDAAPLGIRKAETHPVTFANTPYHKRIFLSEREKLLVSVDEENKKLLLTPFDVNKILADSGIDYLFVVSRPPRSFAPGEKLRYPVAVRSKQGGVQLKLKSGPPGMRLEKEELSWQAPRDLAPSATIEVSLSITDNSKQEVTHAFTLRNSRPAPPAVVQEPRATAERPKTERPKNVYTGPQTFVQSSAKSVQMPEGLFSFAVDPATGGMLVVKGSDLAMLKPDGITIARQHDLGACYIYVAGREEYIVSYPLTVPELHLLDRKTLAIQKKIPLPSTLALGLVPHPRRPISYFPVLMSKSTMAGGQIVVVDERTGTARAERRLGSFLAIDPTGKTMFAAVAADYHRGSELLINPDRIHLLPQVGRFEILIRYRLDREGQPLFEKLREDASDPQRGLRMSPDGKLAAAVMLENAVRIWKTDKLESTTIVTQTRGFNDFAFHPTLKIAAALFGDGFPKLVDAESGNILEADVDVPRVDLQGGRFEHLYFSPDGKSLVLASRGGSVDSLVRASFEHSPELLARRWTIPPVAPAGGEKSPLKLPLAQLHALRGGRGAAMSPKEINKIASDSVVIVRNQDESGTGLVVGNAGYVLTCAHCVDELGENSVIYRRRDGEKREEKTVAASVVRIDTTRDLALLKMVTGDTFVPPAFAPPQGVENGEPVTVIANPGLGAKVLSHTLTEGIVSNRSRDVGGRKHIQTSAAVNPGSSGGTVFNDHGLVVGMVTMKAGDEGAGIAIPCRELSAFLLESAQLQGPAASLKREWHDASGRSVTADYLESSEDSIRLRRQDGKDLSVKLESLSVEDREFVQLLNRSRKR